MSEPSTTIIPSTFLRTDSTRKGLLVALVCQLILAGFVQAAENPLRQVAVADPFLEMHTGPGRGYPVFHVVDRGESISIVKQRTSWFLVRTGRDVEGWVDREQMALTIGRNGEPFDAGIVDIEDFTYSKWELGVLAGDFGGSNIVSLYGGYSLNQHVSVEGWGSQILGNSSNGWMGGVNVVHETFPEWRVSPFFTLGAGVIHTQPKSTIVQGEDRTDQIGHAGAGFRIYAARSFVLRAEYKTYVVFTSRDDNEEVEEWKIGFAVFF
jgi:hypothetical protein